MDQPRPQMFGGGLRLTSDFVPIGQRSVHFPAETTQILQECRRSWRINHLRYRPGHECVPVAPWQGAGDPAGVSAFLTPTGFPERMMAGETIIFGELGPR